MAILNASNESIPGHHAGIGALDIRNFNNLSKIIVGRSESTNGLLAFTPHPSPVAQVTDVNEPLSGTIDLVIRPLGEHVRCRLALSPDVWLAMIDRAQSISQHLLRRQSKERHSNFICRDL